jgi:hypothetical protein
VNERVEVVDDPLVGAIELRSGLAGKRCVGPHRRDEAGGQRSVDALEELQEDEADRIALGQEPVARGVRQLFDETSGAQFGEIVAQRGEGVAIGGRAEGVANARVEVVCREAVGGGDMTEAHERVHERELPRVIELEAGSALSGGGDRRVRQLSQLPAIDEGFQDVLLHVEVVVVDGRERRAQRRQVVDRFADAVIGDVVGRSFGAQDEMVAHVSFDEAVNGCGSPGWASACSLFRSGACRDSSW